MKQLNEMLASQCDGGVTYGRTGHFPMMPLMRIAVLHLILDGYWLAWNRRKLVS